ncbi:hypothetical protein FOMPIDRAFT_1124670 [Fomitopsis schrenkii]|uniref:Fungal pheromone STE3G-protein-coupled receptor n=1 Tax=Fomitopsis schrenkii TaxID=2126942 RepID=S8FLX9_FOMSC|nr:hypothetical protein FOMPIDRAFT_1124670 [Fomitopsis schrenkii]
MSLYPAYSVLALLAAFVILIPLPWHLQALNSGTCLYMIWTALACLNYGVNTIVWRSTVIDYAPVWCDISSRIIVATAVGIPTASLCINRRLYKIASMKIISVSKAEKRRALLVDLLIGVGIPVVQIVMQYIVSGHRFDIYEEFGCYPFMYNTWLAYPLSVVWPIIIGIVSAVYCILSLRAFAQRRAQFSEFVSSSSGLSANRYFRLMALATAELLCTTPIAAYGLYLNLSAGPLSPWISWENVHYDYSQVHQYPSVIWRASRANVIAFHLSLWAPVFCAFVFFAFFGFADEARRNYLKAWTFVTKLFSSINIPSRYVSFGSLASSEIDSFPDAFSLTKDLPR